MLRHYLRFDTSQGGREEIAAALYLATPLQSIGEEVTIEILGGKRANLWSSIKGKSSEKILLLGHLDVDPIRNLEKWRFPPFTAAIEGPWLYGRGVFDMKSMTIAQLWAISTVKYHNPIPQKTILFLTVSTEEIGSDLGMRWIMNNYPQLLDKVWVALGEGGIVESDETGKIKYWGIEHSQKGSAIETFCTTSKERLTAIKEDLNWWYTTNIDKAISVSQKLIPTLLEYASSREGKFVRELLSKPNRTIKDLDYLSVLPWQLYLLFADVIIPTKYIKRKDNVYTLDLIYSINLDNTLSNIRKVFLPSWISWEVPSRFTRPITFATPTYTSFEHKIIKHIKNTLLKHFPDSKVGPIQLTVTGSDIHFIRLKGGAGFGFYPFPFVVFDTMRSGKANERISIENFVKGVDIFTEILVDSIHE